MGGAQGGRIPAPCHGRRSEPSSIGVSRRSGWPTTTYRSTKRSFVVARCRAGGPRPAKRWQTWTWMPSEVRNPASRVSSADAATDEIVEIGNRYYVLASSSLAEEDQRILKDGESF